MSTYQSLADSQRLELAQIQRGRLQANRVDFAREAISISYAKDLGATASFSRPN